MEKEGFGNVFKYRFCMEGCKKNEGERSHMRKNIYYKKMCEG
jgi:hypothetical protein